MIGKLLAGHYKIIKVLATGGFGKTYIVEDIHLPGNPRCVLKHLTPPSNDPQLLDTARRLFQKEAETLQKLGDHNQIPRLFAYFEENQEFYLVQELINGHTLAQELPDGKIWNQTQTSEMLAQVLQVLAFVHSQGVIHRDIKPDNIIRRAEDNKLVLIDFGAIKQIRNQSVIVGSQASVSVAIGTPGYMPTEQSQGKPRPNSDIYALGMIGIQSLTGLYPYQLQEDPQTGETLWQHLVNASPELIAILEKMTRYHFKDRYQTAEEAASALSQSLQAPNLGTQPVAKTVKAQSVFPFQQKTIPVAPANPLSSPPVPVSTAPKLLRSIGLGIGLVVVGAIAKVAYDHTNQSLNPDPNISPTPTLQQSCFALASGNIRSAPTSSQENVITSVSGEKLEITGKQTPGGWIEVKLANGNLGWVHQSRISNQAEMDGCAKQNNISQVVDDLPPSAQPTQTNTDDPQKINQELSESTSTIIKCSTDEHSIKVTGDDDRGYTYTAYENQNSNPFVLKGQKEDVPTGEIYIFNNGNYSYIVSQSLKSRGGQVYLSVIASGKPIYNKPCQ